jgi:hypothetical protein
MSPLEIRRRNLYRIGDETPTGQVLRESVAAEEVLERAAEAPLENDREISVGVDLLVDVERLPEKDLEELPETVRQEMRFEFVDTIAEALDRALEPAGGTTVADDEIPARAANL